MSDDRKKKPFVLTGTKIIQGFCVLYIIVFIIYAIFWLVQGKPIGDILSEYLVLWCGLAVAIAILALYPIIKRKKK